MNSTNKCDLARIFAKRLDFFFFSPFEETGPCEEIVLLFGNMVRWSNGNIETKKIISKSCNIANFGLLGSEVVQSDISGNLVPDC